MKLGHFFTMLVAFVAMALGLATPDALSDELRIKERPLTWQDARLTHGEDLFVELCAVCHGQGGKGDGPAVSALQQIPPDLTTLSARNDGEFPFDSLERFIAGRARTDVHGTINMPIWGSAFYNTRPDWKTFRREQLARHRIHNIVEYLESLQAE